MPVAELSPRERFLKNPPVVLLGGRGVYVSRAREIHAGLKAFGPWVGGAVSLTGISNIVAGQLRGREYNQIGASLDAFPDPNFSKRVERNFGAGGKYKFPPKPGRFVHDGTEDQIRDLTELFIFASFAEVFEAKNGNHGDEPVNGAVGVNILDKIPFNLANVLGALVGEVDYFAAGAGIPSWLPTSVDDFIAGRESTYLVFVQGREKRVPIRIDPTEYLPRDVIARLKRPAILPIFSSTSLTKRYGGIFDGFIYEGRLAGGHLGPEGKNGIVMKEAVELEKDKPRYLAGNSSHKLAQVLKEGLTGIQIGTIATISKESGYPEAKKLQIVAGIHDQTLQVITDPDASPTGYEFNVVVFGSDNDTASNPDVYAGRRRNCSEGFLVGFRQNSTGKIVEYCPAEPFPSLARKLEIFTPDMSEAQRGIAMQELKAKYGRTQCLCNLLEAAAGYSTPGYRASPEDPTKTIVADEPMLLTLGSGVVVDPDARAQVLRLTPDPRRLPTIAEVLQDVLTH